MSHNARRARLLMEQERLINLAARSEFIKVEPLEVLPGMPPEKYVVTFTCKGIAKLNEKSEPEASEFHQVSIYISRDFPRQEPYLKWLTPIWHPNIEHEEPHHVCTNNVQNFYATKGLDDLVVSLGEMVQYKWYHAKWEQPWPLDKEAAKWVVDVAEPRGIIGPDKPFDTRPLLRSYKIRAGGKVEQTAASSTPVHPVPESKKQGMKLGDRRESGPLTPTATTGSLTPPTTGPLTSPDKSEVRKTGMTFGAKRNQ